MSTAPEKLDPEQERKVLELLAGLLAERWPGAEVSGVDPLPGDASTRRYLRCRLRGAGAPASLVAMLLRDAAMATSSEELGVFGSEGPAELPFLNIGRFLARLTPAVPEIMAVAGDATVVVLEDLGDVSLWEAISARPADAEDLLGQALDLIADLQHKAVDDGSGCYAFRQRFDRRLFNWELEEFLSYGLVKPSKAELSEARAELADLAGRLAALPQVFCHRDYHAWNIHVQAGALRVFDFQDALLGPALYDVASLLTDRRTPEIVDEAMAERLVLRFRARQGTGALLDSSATLDAYRACALQRSLKVLGRFNQLADVKGKPGYLPMLPAVAAGARSLAARFPSMRCTNRLLAEKARVATDRGATAAP